METEQIKRTAEQLIRENPAERILHFTRDGKKYWIKRKLGNGRNQLVKYSVEKEFYYEIARMTIAGKSHPELVPEIAVLSPDYMVTLDGGPTLKNILDSELSEKEKESILKGAGAALASLHKDSIIHGRPALRDITYREGRFTFLDWENRLYSKNREEQKAIDFLLLLHGICRENYREEQSHVKALQKGYAENGGQETIAKAKRFLLHHSIIDRLVHVLSPFHMTDVESLRKLYDYLK